jgi:hypothetical protein
MSYSRLVVDLIFFSSHTGSHRRFLPSLTLEHYRPVKRSLGVAFCQHRCTWTRLVIDDTTILSSILSQNLLDEHRDVMLVLALAAFAQANALTVGT